MARLSPLDDVGAAYQAAEWGDVIELTDGDYPKILLTRRPDGIGLDGAEPITIRAADGAHPVVAKLNMGGIPDPPKGTPMREVTLDDCVGNVILERLDVGHTNRQKAARILWRDCNIAHPGLYTSSGDCQATGIIDERLENCRIADMLQDPLGPSYHIDGFQYGSFDGLEFIGCTFENNYVDDLFVRAWGNVNNVWHTPLRRFRAIGCMFGHPVATPSYSTLVLMDDLVRPEAEPTGPFEIGYCTFQQGVDIRISKGGPVTLHNCRLPGLSLYGAQQEAKAGHVYTDCVFKTAASGAIAALGGSGNTVDPDVDLDTVPDGWQEVVVVPPPDWQTLYLEALAEIARLTLDLEVCAATVAAQDARIAAGCQALGCA